jgi:hypothetical protein
VGQSFEWLHGDLLERMKPDAAAWDLSDEGIDGTFVLVRSAHLTGTDETRHAESNLLDHRIGPSNIPHR